MADHQGQLKNNNSFINWPLVVLIGLLLLAVVYLLLKPDPLPPVPPPGHRPAPPPHNLKSKTITGVVKEYLFNPHFDINAIRVNTASSGLITIDFRPHTAQAVEKVAPVNTNVEISYHLSPNDETVGYRLSTIRDLSTGELTDVDRLPPPPDLPPGYHAENFVLAQPQLVTDSYGGIVAIKDPPRLFHFKPGLVDDILPLIKSTDTIGLTAVRRDEQSGFINVNHEQVYIVLNVSIDHKTFLVR